MPNATVTATEYRYRCLGPCELVGPEERVIALRTRKHWALLYYLARRRGTPASRDQLVELLWPEDPVRRARHSLAQAGSLINKAMGTTAVIAAGKDLLALRADVLALDVDEFEALVARSDWEGAHALWRGDLLEGLWVQRAPLFEQWVTEERARLTRMARVVLNKLAARRRESGDWEAMKRAGEGLLRLDALDESAVQLQVEALILLGERSRALRLLADFRHRLKQELDASPSRGLMAWFERLKDGRSSDQPLPQVHRVSEVQVLPNARPLFGRDHEFGRLWATWEQTKSGKGCFTILEGVAGIGKTALASKLANQAHVLGGSVAFVKCYGVERAVPFSPVAEIARQLSRLPGFVGMDAVWISELSRLAPELRQRYKVTTPPPVPDDSTRSRLCDAVVQACLAVSAERPLLLVVDDIHDADDASLALIHYLGRQSRNAGFNLICLMRTGAATADSLGMFIATARSGGLAEHMLLRELETTSIAQLVTEVLATTGEPASDSRVREVQTASAGNPLRAIEACLSSLRPTALPGTQSTSEFQLSSADRLGALSVEARAVAQVLAVARRPLPEHKIAAIAALDGGSVPLAIGQLMKARFVRRSGEQVELSHDEYAVAVYGTLSDTEKRILHGRVADQLLRDALAAPSVNYEIALHLSQAGERRRAVVHAQAGAEYAKSVGATRDRARALELALELDSTSVSTALALELCDTYLALGADERLDRLVRLIQANAPESPDAAYYSLALSLRAGSISCEDAASRLQSLLTSPHLRRRGHALLLLMRLADSRREYDVVRRAVRTIRALDDEARAFYAIGYRFSKYYDPARGLTFFAAAQQVAQRHADTEMDLTCQIALGIALKQVGRFSESVRQFDAALAYARKTLSPESEASILHNRAVTEMAQGNFEQVRRTHKEADQLTEAFPNWVFGHYRDYNEAMALMLEGNLERSSERFNQAAAAAQSAGLQSLALQAVAGVGLTAARIGDLPSLARSADKLRHSDVLRNKGCTWVEPAALAWDLAKNCNNPTAAQALLGHWCRQLRRRDVAMWLSCLAECLRLQEFVEGRPSSELRAELRNHARTFEADWVIRILPL